jgi:hypothetical protein
MKHFWILNVITNDALKYVCCVIDESKWIR